MTFKIDRRTLLRGSVSGVSTAVGLPLLECMFSSSSAYADAPGQYPRFFAMYVPNGIIEEHWFPGGNNKTGWDLKGTALEPFQQKGLQNDISLYQGMRNAGYESKGNNHLTGIASWLTGNAIESESSRRHTPSLDQELASALPRTKVHSLQLAGNSELDKPNNNRYYNAMKNGLSWNMNGALLPLKSELRSEFDRLYSGGGDGSGGIDRRTQMHMSVLDDVKADREQLLNRVSAEDAVRLDEYFESLRDLELSLIAATSGEGMQCERPTVGDVPNPRNGSGNNAIGDHGRIAAKIVANAFACGLTNAVTYCAGGEAAGCQYNDIGVGRHFHNAISHKRAAQYDNWRKIDRLHADICSSFMKEMKDTRDGAGNLLNGTTVMFGSGLGDGSKHQHTNIALMVGGHFGKWQHGNRHKLDGRNHADLVDTLREEMGLGKRFNRNSVPIS